MDFSKLSAADKRILFASIAVIVGGLVSVIDRWGIGGIVGLFAGLGAAGVILQPQLMPTMKLPMPKVQLLLALGAVAAGGFALSALQYLSYVFEVTRIFTILFDIGLVGAFVLLYFTWLDYSRGRSTAPAAAPETPPAAPPAA